MDSPDELKRDSYEQLEDELAAAREDFWRVFNWGSKKAADLRIDYKIRDGINAMLCEMSYSPFFTGETQRRVKNDSNLPR